jgi:hypothetical protein
MKADGREGEDLPAMEKGQEGMGEDKSMSRAKVGGVSGLIRPVKSSWELNSKAECLWRY